jgi:iron complex outermembrane receptor protein
MHYRLDKIKIIATTIVCLFPFVTISGLPAGAEESDTEPYQLDEVVVTAEKTKEDKQDIPASITVIEGHKMEDLGISHLDDLTNVVPNVHFDKIDSHLTQINFRGIGGMANMNKVWNINLDGVTVPYVGVDSMLDVERVEFLRGSQGALYGRNTYAGVVNVVTRGPSDVFSLDTSLFLESFNTQKGTLAFGGPIGTAGGYRFAFGYGRSDGYMENDYLDKDDGGRHDQLAGRGKLQFSPSPDSRWTLSMTADRYDARFDVYTLLSRGATTKTVNNEPGKNKGHLLSPTLTWEKGFGSYTLTSITNYSASNYLTRLDQDFTQMDLMLFNYDEDFHTWTQEFRLENKEAWGGRLRWLTGLFLMDERIDMVTDITFGSDASAMGMTPGLYMGSKSSIDSQGGALFGRVTYQPIKKVEMSAGLRADVEKRKMDWRGLSGIRGSSAFPDARGTLDNTWTALLPSASLSYIFSDTQRIYGSVSRGYHVGDYAANQVQWDVAGKEVDPEYTMTYEVGYKGLLANKRFELNGAVFYIDWSDMQVSVVDQTTSTAYYQNAAEAHSYGFELESRWRATENLHFFGTFGWLKGEFDRYDNHTSGRDLAGNRIPNANKYSLSVGTVYRSNSGLFGSMSVAFMGPKYMDELNQYRQTSYTLLNAKIGYERPKWAAYLYGRNLLDEKYLVHRFGDAGRAGEPLVVGFQASLRI